MKFIKPTLTVLALIIATTVLIVYLMLRASLPELDGNIQTPNISADISLKRDAMGTAVIHAQSQKDVAYALGYAHGQDRLFQMDLLRRNAAGELSEIVGKAAINVDKRHRFHQFRKRAKAAYLGLPDKQKLLLETYAKGVNDAASKTSVRPFEYLLTQSSFSPWLPEDSLLTSYSMYLDLQGGQVERDLVNTIIKERFGNSMLRFFNLPSPYQAALDSSVMSGPEATIPDLSLLLGQNNLENKALYGYDSIEEVDDIGSNNWAVTGELTNTGSAMVSDDMHLGLSVPHIWYRAQLNYPNNNQSVRITGVTLPGTPLIIVGSNGKVAWGFTNANLDNVDWIELAPNSPIEIVSESINTPEGPVNYDIEMSQFGPVRSILDKKFALQWVAHQPYAVNMQMSEMAHAENLANAFEIANEVRIPVQNLMLADADGNAGWRPIGAVTSRNTPTLAAIPQSNYSELWQQAETQLPEYINPDNGRLWTANARVMSSEDMQRFGDGGYALGIRGLQIRDLMFAKQNFAEQDFYKIQLDNEARFIDPWHTLLLKTLKTHNRGSQAYQADINALENWDRCACSDSIGYTLARKYRSAIINALLSPISEQVSKDYFSLRNALRKIEPAVWLIIDNQANSWLPKEFDNFDDFLFSTYENMRTALVNDHKANPTTLAGLEWGVVNELRIEHPFSSQLGPLGSFLNMPEVAGFGDSYMPAVQRSSFGASQRFIAQPGNEESAIMTVPGGQSGHPLSEFFKLGFEEYATNASQPLLPESIKYELIIQKQEAPE